MGKITNEVEKAQVRTHTEKAFKDALLYLLGEANESVIDTDELKIPVSENNKDVLKAFADERDLEIEEPKHKPQYVEAVDNWLKENS